MLRKGVYLYEYMDNWEKVNGTTLPKKEKFHRNLNMEEITDVDYMHGKIVCRDFKIKKFGKYHDILSLKKHYFWLMFLKSLQKCVDKFIN